MEQPAEPVPERRRRRSGKPESRLDRVLGLQLDSRLGHTRARFEVTFDRVAKTATWTDRSYDLGDLPLTDTALDDAMGDVYVSNDFGVLRLAKGMTSWSVAGEGLPIVEVPGLTIVPGARRLYAATHG